MNLPLRSNISFDSCLKCTICTVYCPVTRVTEQFPGPKQSGPDTERLRIKDRSLSDTSLYLCTNCKRCETVCPSDVNIASMIQRAKWEAPHKRWTRLRDLILSRTDFVGGIATATMGLANLVLKPRIIRLVMEIILKIPASVPLLSYGKGTFRNWYRKQEREKQEGYKRRVRYFHGCYVNYNDQDLGKSLIRVLNALDIGVIVNREVCCGVPMVANGFYAAAKKQAGKNIRELNSSIDQGCETVVATSSSCTLMLKQEYPDFLEMETGGLESHIEYISHFLCRELDKQPGIRLKPVNKRLAYHSPCHLERLGNVRYTIQLLKQIPGLDLVILPSECCGIAGTYGFKAECAETSARLGRELYYLINRAAPEAVITDCETCAHQIRTGTGITVLHPVQVLEMALDSC